MIREAKEEIGIIIKQEDIKCVHIMNRNFDDERVDFFFLAKKWEGEIKNMELNKCDDLKWFDIDSLPHNIIRYVSASIENFRNKVFYTEFGWW